MADISRNSGSQAEEKLDKINSLLEKTNKISSYISSNTSQTNQLDNITVPSADNIINQFNNKEQQLTLALYPIDSIFITENNSPPNLSGSEWELINLKVAIDRQVLFNSYFNVNHFTLEVDSEGKVWFVIFDHNSNKGSNVYNYTTALRTDSSAKWSQWWVLLVNDTLFRNSNGSFEFKLFYPNNSSTGCNHFQQTSNPVLTNDKVTGYKAISCTWTTNFHGLSYDGTYCLLSGQANTSNWWYAIAPYQSYNGGVPGPESTVVTGRTQVKIRVPQLENNNIISTLIEHYYWRRIK